jgi:hypothetical protein
MKTNIYYLTLFLTLWSTSALCATYTVSNVPATLAQFNSIQAACDAAVSGDTIYVYGSPNIYASFTVLDKKLTIIGPGWSPVKNLPYTAQVAGCNIRDSAGPGAPDGTELQGLVFTQNVNLGQAAVGGDTGTDNLRVIRCQFNNTLGFSYSASGILFESNIFYSTMSFAGSETYQNILFQNNLFFFSTCCLGSHISGLTNTVNVRFDHNLFYSTNNNGGNNVFIFGSNCNAITLTNNIFNQANAGSNLSFSTFANNITNNAGLNASNATANATPWLVNSNVDGGGNISNQNPQMVDMTSINAGNGSPLLNYTISAGPANNSGSDGKDLGLLFDSTGSLNWDNGRNSRVPRIFSMNITTPTIPVGGNLSVTVEARKSN